MRQHKLGIYKLYLSLDKVLVLFFLIFLFMEYAWLPLNSIMAASLLQQTGYLFISYNNILGVLSSNPLITLGFLGLILVNLIVAYFQLALLFTGARNILLQKDRTLLEFIRKTLADGFEVLKRVRPSKLVFVLTYILVLFPFFRKILKIYYLNKILIPNFIRSYLEQKYFPLAILFSLAVLAFFLLAVRLVFTLPKILLEDYSVGDAISYSLKKTKKRLFSLSWQVFWMIIKSFLLFFAILLPLLVIQTYADAHSQSVSITVGIIAYALMKNAYYLTLSYFLIKFVSFFTEQELVSNPRRKLDRVFRSVVIAVASLFFAWEGYLFLVYPMATPPAIISHRGVSEENGVQNTIESLEKTAQLQPDYVEMDVQETKDGQFVMMHDANLADLAGVDASPQDLTLAELTALEVSENGHRAKIPSFDAYLKRANELGQKLLIEIKTSDQDSSDMMERFLKKYAQDIKQHGHQMQSLDYQVIEKVVQYDSDIQTFFILPYNTIFPRTKATGYTMEYSTLDENFTNKIWTADKLLYDWTINDEDSIAKSVRLGVDGMITDDLELVKSSIQELQNNPKYADLLALKATDFFNFE